jgi:putative flavoprotein involved in K+ transport
MSSQRHEVIVIGAGQAGLAMGYFLTRDGRDFVILEASEEPAASWRGRWDSLKLFTPARYSGLPGLPFSDDPDRYPTRDEVALYLSDYGRRFDLPIRYGSRVHSLRRADGIYRAEVDGAVYEAEQVVVATGPFQVPFIPPLAEGLAPEVRQLHSSAYRSPETTPAGPVLVVGGGNSGFQIAEELAQSRDVHLAIGSRQPALPQRILGRDLFWFLEKTGLIRKTTESRIGQRLKGRDTLIGSSPRGLRRRYGVKIHPRAVSADGSGVRFADGSELEVGAVVWATGYRPDYSWIEADIFGDDGRLLHQRGVTRAPGLYFLGLTWQYTRGSALIGWVKDDAADLADRIGATKQTTAGARPLAQTTS